MAYQERDLIERLLEGDLEAFEEFFGGHWEIVGGANSE